MNKGTNFGVKESSDLYESLSVFIATLLDLALIAHPKRPHSINSTCSDIGL